MITLALLAALPGADSLVGLLFWVAIAAIVGWGIWELVKWMGIPIPRPVVIIFICLISILLIVLLFRLFGFAV